MVISSNLTHFSLSDKDTLKLANPQGKIVFDYSTSLPIAVAKPLVAKPAKIATSVRNISSVNNAGEENKIKEKILPDNANHIEIEKNSAKI